MSFKLLTICILFNILFSFSVTLAQGKLEQQLVKENNIIDLLPEDSYPSYLSLDIAPAWSTTEEATVDPQDVNVANPDDTNSLDESVKNTTDPEDNLGTGDRNVCPKGQSSFSKGDLIDLIEYVAKSEINITVGLSANYLENATNVRNFIIQDFNDFIAKFENRPEHLLHVLNDLGSIRKEKAEPLVAIVSLTLQEYTSLLETYNMLYSKNNNIVEQLNRYKQICNWNCNMQNRANLRMNTDTVPINNIEDYLCSTLENVHIKVNERLKSFEQEELENIKNKISQIQMVLNNAIQALKISLKEAAVAKFGITMYDLLSVNDDQYHFIEYLEEFQEKSYTSLIKKNIMSIEFRLIELEDKLRILKHDCLNCNRRSYQHRSLKIAIKKDVATTLEVADQQKNNVLDQLIDNKINSIQKTVANDFDGIFRVVNEIVNNKELVEVTIAKLTPLQETVSDRIQEEKQQLQTLMLRVPNDTLENVKNLYLKSQLLARTIDDEIKSI